MFTGLVEATGRIKAVARTATGASITVAAHFSAELSVGDSVAVNGVCLTVTARTGENFTVDVIPETLGLTTFAAVKSGDAVNLERSLALGDRLGGHVVTGHVDGRGTVTATVRSGDGTRLVVELAPELMRYVVPRGSIAIDGTSLTVTGVEDCTFAVALIPETLRATVAEAYREGSTVNIETDILAKHIERLLEAREETAQDRQGERGHGLTMERLRDLGLVE